MGENQFLLTRRRRLLAIIIGAAILCIIILAILSGVIQKWLWMQQLNYAGIFWTLLSFKWQMFCLAFVATFLYLWINLHHAAKKSAVSREGNSAGSSEILSKSAIQVSPASLKLAEAMVSALVDFSLRSCSIRNGTRISAFVMVAPSDCRTLSSESMSGFISFVCRSISSCRISLDRVDACSRSLAVACPLRVLRACCNSAEGDTAEGAGSRNSASFRTPFHPGR